MAVVKKISGLVFVSRQKVVLVGLITAKRKIKYGDRY